MSADPDVDKGHPAPDTERPLARLKAQCLANWRSFPSEQERALEELLGEALERAKLADVEVITVMNPVSRPARLKLAVLVADPELDVMYRQEWAELSVDVEGRCFLVYRRRDGAHYAIEWSPATPIPASTMGAMPEGLALAMLDGDGNDS